MAPPRTVLGNKTLYGQMGKPRPREGTGQGFGLRSQLGQWKRGREALALGPAQPESGLGLHWGLWRVLEEHLSLMG